MSKKKWLLLIGLVIGGMMVFFSLNGDRQLTQEEQRNREYEVSLVKALKNSYRDIEEIRIIDAIYYEPPGSWGCVIDITFSDNQSVKYNLGHSLYYDVNKSAVAHPEVLELLRTYYGTTDDKIKIIYSNGEIEVK